MRFTRFTVAQSEAKLHQPMTSLEILQVCQRDTLNMTLDATQAETLRTNLNFVLDLLEVASTLAPPSDQCKGENATR